TSTAITAVFRTPSKHIIVVSRALRCAPSSCNNKRHCVTTCAQVERMAEHGGWRGGGGAHSWDRDGQRLGSAGDARRGGDVRALRRPTRAANRLSAPHAG